MLEKIGCDVPEASQSGKPVLCLWEYPRLLTAGIAFLAAAVVLLILRLSDGGIPAVTELRLTSAYVLELPTWFTSRWWDLLWVPLWAMLIRQIIILGHGEGEASDIAGCLSLGFLGGILLLGIAAGIIHWFDAGLLSASAFSWAIAVGVSTLLTIDNVLRDGERLHEALMDVFLAYSGAGAMFALGFGLWHGFSLTLPLWISWVLIGIALSVVIGGLSLVFWWAERIFYAVRRSGGE